MNIQTYLDRLARRLHHLNPQQRHAALTEIHGHLHEEARRLHADGLAPAAAEAAAIEAFGRPEEIAVAYGPQGGEVRGETGEVLLRIARGTGRAAAATGRGAGQVLKVLGIVALVAVGVALVVLLGVLAFAGTALVTFQDEIREAVPRPIYGYSDERDMTEPRTELHTNGFDVGPEMKEFRIVFDTAPEAGCVRIRLTDPSGDTVNVNGNGCDATSYGTTFTEQGRWTVEYAFIAYAGSVDAEAWGFERAR